MLHTVVEIGNIMNKKHLIYYFRYYQIFLLSKEDVEYMIHNYIKNKN